MSRLEDLFDVLVADDGLEEGTALVFTTGKDIYGNPVVIDAVKIINIEEEVRPTPNASRPPK